MTDPDHRQLPRPGGRSAKVRDAVLRAALAVLNDGGLPTLTIPRVAAASGVHESTIYRRWKTAHALAFDAVMQFAETSVGTPDTGSLRTDLTALVEDVASVLTGPRGRALIELCRIGDKPVADARSTVLQARFNAAHSIFLRAAQRGENLPGLSPDVILHLLISPLYFRAVVTGLPLHDWPIQVTVDLVLASVTTLAHVRGTP